MFYNCSVILFWHFKYFFCSEIMLSPLLVVGLGLTCLAIMKSVHFCCCYIYTYFQQRNQPGGGKNLILKCSSLADKAHLSVAWIPRSIFCSSLSSGGAVFATATLRQCRTWIRRRYRVECVSLEQVPAERNAATRERTTHRVRLPPELSRSPVYHRRCREAAWGGKKPDVAAGLKKERATPGEGN